MAQRRKRRKTKKEFVRTSIYLEKDLWKELKWEAIEKQTTLSELINKKLKELKTLKKKTDVVAEDFEG
jgi:predicted DNA-binding ribbon-helix-helix protein